VQPAKPAPGVAPEKVKPAKPGKREQAKEELEKQKKAKEELEKQELSR
jgi:ribosomal protein L12E/L44/L45/RPP1/RPP2